ncbi:hypothetical protein, partial [Halococcus hamelinensis]|uniref:hypothetical protein n=1 Tax=Halococcus hamelinensis TaxID=332168 RepID=UPI001ED92E39
AYFEVYRDTDVGWRWQFITKTGPSLLTPINTTSTKKRHSWKLRLTLSMHDQYDLKVDTLSGDE